MPHQCRARDEDVNEPIFAQGRGRNGKMVTYRIDCQVENRYNKGYDANSSFRDQIASATHFGQGQLSSYHGGCEQSRALDEGSILVGSTDHCGRISGDSVESWKSTGEAHAGAVSPPACVDETERKPEPEVVDVLAVPSPMGAEES